MIENHHGHHTVKILIAGDHYARKLVLESVLGSADEVCTDIKITFGIQVPLLYQDADFWNEFMKISDHVTLDKCIFAFV